MLFYLLVIVFYIKAIISLFVFKVIPCGYLSNSHLKCLYKSRVIITFKYDADSIKLAILEVFTPVETRLLLECLASNF